MSAPTERHIQFSPRPNQISGEISGLACISHSDDDHSGGAAALVRHFDVGRVLVGEAIPDPGRAVSDCRAGRSWRIDGIEFRFVHPGTGSVMKGNDSSCVLIVSAGRHDLVLTGDIERPAEQELLQQSSFAAASVVLVPHHGSLTSSSPAFVNRLKPRYAIASAAYDNRWGFPKERVTKRWEGVGAVVLDTAGSGAISFRLCAGEGIGFLREERLRQRRFWHD